MNNDEYVRSVVNKYALLSAPTPAGAAAAQAIYPLIQQWAGKYLLKVSYSGSTAKRTAISGITDVDLFFSLSNDTPENLSDIFQKLAKHFEDSGYAVRRQNVSVGITHNGVSLDLVPARKHPGNTSDHSLYRSKAKTWTQTNVDSDAIDIVVFDRHFSPFLFHQEGACYIPAESVYAVFEVKQKADKTNLKYAAKKAVSVRRLKRTSTHFAHSGGINEPVPPKEIIAGLLTLTSEWKSGLGGSFSCFLKDLPRDSRLNLGCVLKAGSFELVDSGAGESKVRLFPSGEALIQFFLAFLAKLQKVGSVPAIDIRAYAGRIGIGTER